MIRQLDTYHTDIKPLFQFNPKQAYEVTEKYPENVFQMAKVETPVGFSKQVSEPKQINAILFILKTI